MWRRQKTLWRVWLMLWLVGAVSCREELHECPVPSQYVSYSCNVNTINAVMQQTKQTHLDSPGGYVRIWDRTKLVATDVVGLGGLLLVQNYEGQYYAFDLACPYCYRTGEASGSRVHRIDIKTDDMMTAYCPNCHSEYGAVFWGSVAPTAGPANQENYVLRQYTAQLLGDILTVSNR